MNITSNQFRTLHGDRFQEFKFVPTKVTDHRADLVDLKGNQGTKTSENTSFLGCFHKRIEEVAEPCLTGSLNELKQRAKLLGTEILEGAQLDGVNVCHLKATTKLGVAAESYYDKSTTVSQTQVRPLQSLADELMPKGIPGRVLVDVKTGSLLIMAEEQAV